MFLWKMSLLVAAVSNFTYDWQSAEISAETVYAPYDARHINATVGLHIGLRGFNVTLRGEPREQFGQVQMSAWQCSDKHSSVTHRAGY